MLIQFPTGRILGSLLAKDLPVTIFYNHLQIISTTLFWLLTPCFQFWNQELWTLQLCYFLSTYFWLIRVLRESRYAINFCTVIFSDLVTLLNSLISSMWFMLLLLLLLCVDFFEIFSLYKIMSLENRLYLFLSAIHVFYFLFLAYCTG